MAQCNNRLEDVLALESINSRFQGLKVCVVVGYGSNEGEDEKVGYVFFKA